MKGKEKRTTVKGEALLSIGGLPLRKLDTQDMLKFFRELVFIYWTGTLPIWKLVLLQQREATTLNYSIIYTCWIWYIWYIHICIQLSFMSIWLMHTLDMLYMIYLKMYIEKCVYRQNYEWYIYIYIMYRKLNDIYIYIWHICWLIYGVWYLRIHTISEHMNVFIYIHAYVYVCQICNAHTWYTCDVYLWYIHDILMIHNFCICIMCIYIYTYIWYLFNSYISLCMIDTCSF